MAETPRLALWENSSFWKKSTISDRCGLEGWKVVEEEGVWVASCLLVQGDNSLKMDLVKGGNIRMAVESIAPIMR